MGYQQPTSICVLHVTGLPLLCQLRVAVRTEELEVVAYVVQNVAVHVIDLQLEESSIPLGSETTPDTLDRNAALVQCSTQMVSAGSPGMLGVENFVSGLPIIGLPTAKVALSKEVSRVDSERLDSCAQMSVTTSARVHA
jgi:hypothetical protein